VLLDVNVFPSAIVKVDPVAGCVIVSLFTVVAVAAPIFGVVNDGLVLNTSDPVPVSSEIAVANCADVPVSVFDVKEIDLFVNVSVVARPTNVSVDVGNVNVPVLDIELMIGVVNVLLVSVSVPANVAKSWSLTAVLNCAMVPDSVLEVKLIVLLVSVSVLVSVM